jgi:hypothetical protein
VLVGERSAVAERAKQLCQQAWAFDVNERADLAIATIEGGPEQQTWENVGRALHAASQVVAGEGAIVVCCDLALPPGPSLQRLAADQTSEEALNELRADHFPDTLTAAQFVDMTENFRVYLRSRLDSDVVESLGIAYVSCDEEITRLSSRHNKCALIGNAHFAVPCPTA